MGGFRWLISLKRCKLEQGHRSVCHRVVIHICYLVFLTLFRCLRKYVNVLLSLFIGVFFSSSALVQSVVLHIASLRVRGITIHLFLEICVFFVKCLIGELVILNLVECLSLPKILNRISIDIYRVL